MLTGGPCGCGPLELELELELLLDDAGCEGWHGCTATVWVSVPAGITIWFEPGGIFALPCCTSRGAVTFGGSSPGRGHGGMTIVIGFFCLPIRTVRVPGVWSATETPSLIELDDELLLPPHALSPVVASAALASAASTRPPLPFRVMGSSVPRSGTR